MMVEAVICSIDDRKWANAAKSLLECPALEIGRAMRILDARSMSEGYNRGANQATAEWLLFCHDDIEVIESNRITLLTALTEWDVIGVCGTTRLTAPNWYDSDPNHLLGSVLAPQINSHRIEHQIFGPINKGILPAQALDGIFIMCRKKVWAALKFDEQLPGFVGYDIDFTYRAYLHDFRVGVMTDLLLFHASHVASFSREKMAQWEESQRFLIKKFNFRGQSDGYAKHACVQYETKEQAQLTWGLSVGGG